MAKKKSKRKKGAGRGKTSVSRSGQGSYCITRTAPRSGNKSKPGGLKFTTVCYKTASKQYEAVKRLAQRGGAAGNPYSVMIYKKKRR